MKTPDHEIERMAKEIITQHYEETDNGKLMIQIWDVGFQQGFKQGFRACEELKEKEKE